MTNVAPGTSVTAPVPRYNGAGTGQGATAPTTTTNAAALSAPPPTSAAQQLSPTVSRKVPLAKDLQGKKIKVPAAQPVSKVNPEAAEGKPTVSRLQPVTNRANNLRVIASMKAVPKENEEPAKGKAKGKAGAKKPGPIPPNDIAARAPEGVSAAVAGAATKAGTEVQHGAEGLVGNVLGSIEGVPGQVEQYGKDVGRAAAGVPGLGAATKAGTEVQHGAEGLVGNVLGSIEGVPGQVEQYGKDVGRAAAGVPGLVESGVKAAGGLFSGKTHTSSLSPQERKVVNTIAQTIFGGNLATGKVEKGQQFTITKATLTETQWKQITTQAEVRLHERTQQGEVPTAQTITIASTYAKFQTKWQHGYKAVTGKAVAAATAQKSYAQAFVQAGLNVPENPTFAEAQTAYQTLLRQGAAGNQTAQKELGTLLTKHRAAAQTAATTSAGAQTETEYFYNAFQAAAAKYGVTQYLTPTTAKATKYLRTQAAEAASAAHTTYEKRTNAEQSFTEQMNQKAQFLYPSLAPQIANGATFKTLTTPYLRLAGTLLGRPGETYTSLSNELGINWNQPKWRALITGTKLPTGKSSPMSVTKARQLIVSTPQYGWATTHDAKALKVSAGQQLLQDFGVRKV